MKDNEKINDGGQVYPIVYLDGSLQGGFSSNIIKGMTLRDYFAGQVIAGAWAKRGTSDLWPNLLAEFAYEIADAMIAQRERD